MKSDYFTEGSILYFRDMMAEEILNLQHSDVLVG